MGTVRTVGVEEELMLFTRSARPAPAGPELAGDESIAAEHELKQEQAEIETEPQSDLADVGGQLTDRRRELTAAASERGLLVAAVGTSPVPVRPTPTPDERYARMSDEYGLVAREQLVCGAHVHVSVESRAEAVAVVDRVQPWLAVLRAMTANSPFWFGEDTGFASYRSVSWGRWPTAGPTAPFGDPAGYDRAVEELIATGAALDRAMIYFDARLSATYPTVEFRVADVGQHVAESVLLAGLCRALVDTAARADAPAEAAPLAILQAASWQAARTGLSGELVDVAGRRRRPAADLVDRLLDLLAPALRANGDEELVSALTAALLRRGTGAALQRADAGTGGPRAAVTAAARRTSEPFPA